MNNEELRNMYANLLASSMNKTVKNHVHPSFVEIIKQLSPDEAKILQRIYRDKVLPTVSVVWSQSPGIGIVFKLKNFSNVGEDVNCDYPFNIQQYFDNLIRLGLCESPPSYSLTDKTRYNDLKSHYLVQSELRIPEDFNYQSSIHESLIRLTSFGKVFCEICLDS